MDKVKKKNLIYLLLIIPMIILLGLSFFSTSVSANADSTKTYTYTFKYLEEYWIEDGRELFGENVIINATNDIIEKNNKGWSVKDIASDSCCIMNYGEFSNKYYLIWQTKTIKLKEGQKPNLNQLRQNFNCFYNIFSYWSTDTGLAFHTSNLPEATSDITFTANYEIKKNIALESDDPELLTYYPNAMGEIELNGVKISVKGVEKTVYFYTFDITTLSQNCNGYYKYYLFKNAGVIFDENVKPSITTGNFLFNYLNRVVYKISPININQDDLVLRLDSTFKDQNQFNAHRSTYTKKNYSASLGNAFVDAYRNTFGNDGILDSLISATSSGSTLVAGAFKTGANFLESAANSVWIFADFTSNAKTTLIYIVVIIIVCLIVLFILKFIFWFINQLKKLTKKEDK